MADICQFILDNEDFNLDEIDGKAVLFYAAENDQPGVIRQLYFKGLDLNITDDKGKTAVFYANENRSMDALCELIIYWAQFKLDEIDGKAVLFHVAENDQSGVIRQLYFKGLDLNITDDKGKTAVFYANENHSMDALCELIIYWAQFKLDEIDGKAVLFHVAENDQSGVIRQLYFKGLDLNITDDKGKTAVFYANENGSMCALCELIIYWAQFKLDEIDGKAVLFHVAENDQSGVIRQLYFKGLDLNITDDKGKTAVFYANENCSMDALCELIDLGAEFKLDEIDGKAVLFHAAENGEPEVIRQLYFEGLDLNITDDKGKTAVCYANENRSMDALCDLIGCDAEFKLDEIDGKAVLFYAAENDRDEVIRQLHSKGLDLNITDDEGKTVVFYADNDFMDALIAVDKVSINARDVYGRTPLFYALEDYTPKKALYLIEQGGNLQFRDSCNASIFSFFVEKCISSSNVEERLQLFTFGLFQAQQQLKALFIATLDIIYCQAPLLSVSDSIHLPKSYMICKRTNVSKALTFAQAQYLNQDASKVEDIEKLSLMINENEINVPHILSLLSKLGANPVAADSDGNTALHYATLLPLFGVTQEAVMEICKKLKELGAIFDVRNQQHQSPLQFCLSSDIWTAVVTENNKWKSSIRGLVEVCRFLLRNGCTINDTLRNGESSVFHRIIVLIQQGLKLNDEPSRKAFLQVLINILKLLPSSKKSVRNVVNSIDNLLNSPLHLWASMALNSSQDYLSCLTEDHSFEKIWQMILHHLLECGAELNPRNAKEETPLHLCKTWTAVKLLLDAGANPIDVDSSGRSPLLAAAKEKTFSKKPDYFYPDVTEDPETFWRSALEKRLDPWTVDKDSKSVLGVLIKSEAYILAKALVDVACKENYDATNDDKISFLNAICKDESRQTHWKTFLVEVILKSASRSHLSVDSALRLCCKNIVQFGMFDEKSNSFQQKPKDEPSNDDWKPPAKKRRKDESSKNEEEKSNEEHESVYCKIAKQLLSYGGVDPSIRDSSGESCLDIAKDCPPLQDLLTKPIEIDAIPILIPWNSVSNKYKGILSKAARRQECEMVGQIWFHRNPIASGSFGFVIAGINEKDGREVAMKRIEKSRMQQTEVKREIENLTVLADCEQVVRYLSFFEDNNFSYVVLELMEGNLVEYLDGTRTDPTQATLLCKDVVMGLKFLHERKLLHRDLKPQNILYKVHPKLCLKIADFGLSRITDSLSTTVYGTHAGTRCWMARELLVSSKDYSKPSDMFSCGLILHYILSGQKHPFNPTNWDTKSELCVAHETEDNIMNSKMEGWDNTLSPEATHLTKRMLESNEGNRPSAKEALEHPLFWSNKKKIDFLEAVGNQKEFEYSKGTHDDVKKKLQKNFYTIAKGRTWWGYKHMPAIGRGMTTTGGGRTYYDTKSAVELVRFIRNVYKHYKEKTFVFGTPGTTIEQLLFNDFVFLEYFPDLVMEVYKAVTTYRWDEEREDINFAMNKTYETS